MCLPPLHGHHRRRRVVGEFQPILRWAWIDLPFWVFCLARRNRPPYRKRISTPTTLQPCSGSEDPDCGPGRQQWTKLWRPSSVSVPIAAADATESKPSFELVRCGQQRRSGPRQTKPPSLAGRTRHSLTVSTTTTNPHGPDRTEYRCKSAMSIASGSTLHRTGRCLQLHRPFLPRCRQWLFFFRQMMQKLAIRFF